MANPIMIICDVNHCIPASMQWWWQYILNNPTDLMNGGDLHYHLSQHGVFNESEMKFYAAEVILGEQSSFCCNRWFFCKFGYYISNSLVLCSPYCLMLSNHNEYTIHSVWYIEVFLFSLRVQNPYFSRNFQGSIPLIQPLFFTNKNTLESTVLGIFHYNIYFALCQGIFFNK